MAETDGRQETNDEAAPPAEGVPAEAPANEASAAAAEVEALRRTNAEFEDKIKRLLADAANMRRRANEDAQRTRETLLGRIVTELLPVLDAFRLALEAPGDRQALLDGVRMVHGMLEDLLYRHGVEPIHALDLPFDPHQHEAVSVIDRTDLPPNTVVAVQQAGYRIGDQILRPARVLVSRAPQAPQGEAGDQPAG